MTAAAPRVVAWSAALISVGVGIALLRTPPSVTSNISPAIEAGGVGNGERVEREPRDVWRAENPPEQVEPSEPPATPVSTAPPKPIPQNAEDLRRASPLLAPIIDANEQTLAAEDKDPLWSTAMETRIVDEISRKALGLEITDLQVDCRTTLCRLNMTFPLQFAEKKFEPIAPDAVWDGKQPLQFFIEALDFDFRGRVPMGLNAYGTPVLVGYVNRPPEKATE